MPCQSIPLSLKFYQLEKLINSLLPFSFWHGIEPPMIFQDLFHGHIPVKGQFLKNNPYSFPDLLGLFFQIVTRNFHFSFLNGQQRCEDIDHSTFPRSIRSQEGENLPFFHRKADIIDSFYLAEKIFKTIYFYYIVFQSQYPIPSLSFPQEKLNLYDK